MNGTILLVDDDPTQRLLLQRTLEKKGGYSTQQAVHGKDALAFLQHTAQHPPALVIMDIHMPEMDGLETLEILRQRFPELPVIMLSGSEDKENVVTAMRLGALDFLSKPADPQHLLVTVRNALRLSSLSKEVSRLTRQIGDSITFDDLIGHAEGLASTITLGRKAASADIPTVITGETGVGKELFARAIHGASNRSGKPFIAVNCGAIPEKLVESTLFGHEKGAFTGATDKTIGKFREAEGGTLFLDEVGELPMDAQVKLLRVLQQKEVEPVGGKKPVPVNVRVISATNRNLQDEVRAGRFRDDLYFRLHVFPIEVPPLRLRKQDIPALAEHFLERFTAQSGGNSKTLTPQAAALLQRHNWPGNVRELENLLHRVFVLGDGATIGVELLEPVLEKTLAPASHNASPLTTGQLALHASSGELKSMEQVELEALQYALNFHGQNVAQAAKALGIAKSTFYRKLSKTSL